MDNDQLHAHCEAWREWCYTRKYFIPPGAKNILARMQPSRVGRPPNAVMSEDLTFFNMAVHALSDVEGEEFTCFLQQYWYQASPVKAAASELNISRKTYYERARRFARKALSLSVSLKRVHNETFMQQKEVAQVD